MTKMKRIYYQPMARQVNLSTEEPFMAFSKEPEQGDISATGEDFDPFEEIVVGGGETKRQQPWSSTPW